MGCGITRIGQYFWLFLCRHLILCVGTLLPGRCSSQLSCPTFAHFPHSPENCSPKNSFWTDKPKNVFQGWLEKKVWASRSWISKIHRQKGYRLAAENRNTEFASRVDRFVMVSHPNNTAVITFIDVYIHSS